MGLEGLGRAFSAALVRATGTAVALILPIVMAGPVAAQEPPIFGDWQTEEQMSTVRLYPCDGKLCGVIVGLAAKANPDGTPILDLNNKHEALRKRPLLGLEFMKGFVKESNLRWGEGWAYNPREGLASDDVEILRIGPDRLEITGCILWGTICVTETWTRVIE